MKKLNYYLSLIVIFNLLVSCNSNKETQYLETKLSNGFTIKLPSDYSNYGNNNGKKFWKSSETSYLFIETTNINSTDLNKVIGTFSSLQDSKELYKNKRLVKKDTFQINNFNGIISYFKNDVKGKGVGLVTLTSYIVFAVVQVGNTQFNIESMTLSDNNFDEITKSIKSISLDSKNLITPATDTFDKNKAIEDGYQVFQEDGFMVKCNGEIKLDMLRIQQMKQSGMADNSKPYHVYHNGADYNINVSRFDKTLLGQSEKEILNYNKNDLDYYQTKFNEMSIKNSRGKFKDYDAVYYENTQNGRTTKAVFFHYKMKSYMLQVTDDNNVIKKFQNFIKTFEII